MIRYGRRRNRVVPYNRTDAVRYAHEWAYKRNPKYYDFENVGGDCTNFASQVIYAGSKIMNYTPVYGWYYKTANDRTASWTGVDFLYKFLVNNDAAGPYAKVVDVKDIKPGDIIQLSFIGGGTFNHSPVVVQTGTPPRLDNILVAAHTYDRDYYPITNYSWIDIRFLHIIGVRRW
jgi:hypothetical protein